MLAGCGFFSTTARHEDLPVSLPVIPSRKPVRAGWEELTNGELIEVAEKAGFDLIVTTDKNIRYRQNLKTRRIALVVLEHSQWPMVKVVAENMVAACSAARSRLMREHWVANSPT